MYCLFCFAEGYNGATFGHDIQLILSNQIAINDKTKIQTHK